MKNLLVALVLVMISLVSQAYDICDGASIEDWRPWPWGSEVSVPWKNISGVWRVVDGSCENLFMFKVKVDQNGEKIVVITQYDPNSCKVITRGLGYEADRYIYAQMINRGQSYNLTIHAFNQSDLSSSEARLAKPSLHLNDPGGKVVLALTLSPVGQWGNRSTFEIERVRATSAMVCGK